MGMFEKLGKEKKDKPRGLNHENTSIYASFYLISLRLN